MIAILEREQLIPLPRAQVFAFFAEAGNLERLTPSTLRFEILTPPPLHIQAGTLIDYRIRLFGVPMRWRTLIEVFEPETRFIDVQLRGPYKSWRHLHEFEDVAGGTKMLDRVEYEVGLGPLGEVARRLFVDRQVESIFDYRREAVARLVT